MKPSTPQHFTVIPYRIDNLKLQELPPSTMTVLDRGYVVQRWTASLEQEDELKTLRLFFEAQKATDHRITLVYFAAPTATVDGWLQIWIEATPSTTPVRVEDRVHIHHI